MQITKEKRAQIPSGTGVNKAADEKEIIRAIQCKQNTSGNRSWGHVNIREPTKHHRGTSMRARGPGLRQVRRGKEVMKGEF